MPSALKYLTLVKSLREQLSENSENSIQNIVQSLSWNDSVYRTFNEGLRLATSKRRKQRIPKTLVKYIHIAHVSYTVIALRKLYEEKKKGAYSVNSIRTITRRIADNIHLFTRENYLTHDKIPYKCSPNLYWKTKLIVEGRHNKFDLLSRFNPRSTRKPNDRIDPLIVNSLHRHAVLRGEIYQFANKFLTHASAIGNRPDEKLTFENLTLNKIQTQYRNVIWAVQQIAKIVDVAVLTQVPVPNYDVLTDWENGLFDDAIKSKLHGYWETRMHWWRKWTDYYRNSTVIFLSPRKQI